MGAGATPTTLAIAAVSHELKVPLIALTPTEETYPAMPSLLDDFVRSRPA